MFLFYLGFSPKHPYNESKGTVNRTDRSDRNLSTNNEMGLTDQIKLSLTLYWVEWCTPKIHANLEPQNVALFGNSVFADITG